MILSFDSALASDARVPVAWDSLFRTGYVQVEWLAGSSVPPAIADAWTLIEVLGRVIEDGSATVEFGQSIEGSSIPIEWQATAAVFTANQNTPIEWAARAVADVGAILGWDHLLLNGYVQVEWLSNTGLLTRDSNILVEMLSKAAADAPIQIENLGAISLIRDSNVPIEVLSKALADVWSRIEYLSLGTMPLSGDTLGNIEFMAALHPDGAFPVEAASKASLDMRFPMEIGAAIMVALTGDSNIPLEVLLKALTDAQPRTEFAGVVITPMTGDNPLLLEIIGAIYSILNRPRLLGEIDQ